MSLFKGDCPTFMLPASYPKQISVKTLMFQFWTDRVLIFPSLTNTTVHQNSKELSIVHLIHLACHVFYSSFYPTWLWVDICAIRNWIIENTSTAFLQFKLTVTLLPFILKEFGALCNFEDFWFSKTCMVFIIFNVQYTATINCISHQ